MYGRLVVLTVACTSSGHVFTYVLPSCHQFSWCCCSVASAAVHVLGCPSYRVSQIVSLQTIWLITSASWPWPIWPVLRLFLSASAMPPLQFLLLSVSFPLSSCCSCRRPHQMAHWVRYQSVIYFFKSYCLAASHMLLLIINLCVGVHSAVRPVGSTNLMHGEGSV